MSQNASNALASWAPGPRAVADPKLDFGDTLTSQATLTATSQIPENTGVGAYLGQAFNFSTPAGTAAAVSILTIGAPRWSDRVLQRPDRDEVPPNCAIEEPLTAATVLAAVRGTKFIVSRETERRSDVSRRDMRPRCPTRQGAPAGRLASPASDIPRGVPSAGINRFRPMDSCAPARTHRRPRRARKRSGGRGAAGSCAARAPRLDGPARASCRGAPRTGAADSAGHRGFGERSWAGSDSQRSRPIEELLPSGSRMRLRW